MRRLLFGTMGVKSLVQGLNAAATAGFEPRTVWSEVRRRNRLATALFARHNKGLACGFPLGPSDHLHCPSLSILLQTEKASFVSSTFSYYFFSCICGCFSFCCFSFCVVAVAVVVVVVVVVVAVFIPFIIGSPWQPGVKTEKKKKKRLSTHRLGHRHHFAESVRLQPFLHFLPAQDCRLCVVRRLFSRREHHENNRQLCRVVKMIVCDKDVRRQAGKVCTEQMKTAVVVAGVCMVKIKKGKS